MSCPACSGVGSGGAANQLQRPQQGQAQQAQAPQQQQSPFAGVKIGG